VSLNCDVSAVLNEILGKSGTGNIDQVFLIYGIMFETGGIPF